MRLYRTSILRGFGPASAKVRKRKGDREKAHILHILFLSLSHSHPLAWSRSLSLLISLSPSLYTCMHMQRYSLSHTGVKSERWRTEGAGWQEAPLFGQSQQKSVHSWGEEQP